MNHVLSKTKQRSLLLVALLLMGCLQLLAQTRTIKGEVTDAQNGDPLIGATIMVEGEKGGTITDFDGKEGYGRSGRHNTPTLLITTDRRIS
jgi:TonB-dependent starch-binding outer membrane protein SusC